jgi:hypothetical protein
MRGQLKIVAESDMWTDPLVREELGERLAQLLVVHWLRRVMRRDLSRK